LKASDASDRWFVATASVVLLAAGATLGAAAGGPVGVAAGGVVGLAAGAALGRRLLRRAARRRALLARPVPHSWRRTLAARSDHYRRLPGLLRERFEHDVTLFLGEKTVTGVGMEATEELRLLVAASAVTLSVAWEDHDWEALAEVLLYPDDFDRDYNFGGAERVGEAHPWGTLILSAPALEESFDDPGSGCHVGLHEFAHLLDLQQGQFDGVPAGLGSAPSREWAALVPEEMDRIRRGLSVLDAYGAESPVEFFAVAVETFFGLPRELRSGHGALYGILAGYFGQDPAAWEDARHPRAAMRRRRERGVDNPRDGT
jgi:MtfA peptidase